MLAAGCGPRADDATVDIEARPIPRESAAAESLAAVVSGHHAIEVRRILAASDPCRTLSAGLVHTGGELTLRVVAEPDGRECPKAETYYAYTARIEDLPPGRYDLRVVHARSGGPEVALDHPVVVMERSVEVP
jgi:hypothetical protein